MQNRYRFEYWRTDIPDDVPFRSAQLMPFAVAVGCLKMLRAAQFPFKVRITDEVRHANR